MGKGTEGAVKAERMETHSMLDFPDALRLVQGGGQVRRAGWAPSLLYIARNEELDQVELVCEGRDGEGLYHFASPYLAAIGGPPVEDLLAGDWAVVEDPRGPTVDGGERATAALLAGIAAEEEREKGDGPADARR